MCISSSHDIKLLYTVRTEHPFRLSASHRGAPNCLMDTPCTLEALCTHFFFSFGMPDMKSCRRYLVDRKWCRPPTPTWDQGWALDCGSGTENPAVRTARCGTVPRGAIQRNFCWVRTVPRGTNNSPKNDFAVRYRTVVTRSCGTAPSPAVQHDWR
jgi:hypothetical protein